MSSFKDIMATTERSNHDQPEFVYVEEERPVREFFKFMYEYFEVANKWTEIQRFGGDHPMASVFLIVTLSTFAIPIVVFLLFVISSAVLSFLGFLFFEGTLLAIGTFVLGGVLFFVGLFAIGFSIFLVASYYMVQMCTRFLVGLRDKLKTIQVEQEKEE